MGSSEVHVAGRVLLALFVGLGAGVLVGRLTSPSPPAASVAVAPDPSRVPRGPARQAPEEPPADTPRDVEIGDQRNLGKRWKLRMDEGTQTLMDAWGGRPYTELEQVDVSIAFFEERAEELGDDLGPMLQGLYERRRRLVEGEAASP